MENLIFKVGEPGTDPTLPDVKLQINGDIYQLAFDFAAIALVGKQTGINLLDAATDVMTFDGIAALLYAATRRAHPAMTLEQVETLVDLRTAFVIRAAVLAAWGASVTPLRKDHALGEQEAQVVSPKA